MAPRRNQRRQRRPRRATRRPGRYYDEYLSFNLKVGTTFTISVGNLTSRPPRCNFRPQFMSVQLVGGFDPTTASDARAGFQVPAAVQIALYSGNTTQSIAATSAPVVLGPQPKTVRVRYPRSSDWFSSDVSATQNFARCSAICLGPAKVNATTDDLSTIRGIIHFRINLSSEIIGETCPVLPHYDNEDDDIFKQYEVIFSKGIQVTRCIDAPSTSSMEH